MKHFLFAVSFAIALLAACAPSPTPAAISPPTLLPTATSVPAATATQLAIKPTPTTSAPSPAPGSMAWTQVNDNAFGILSNFDNNGNPVNPPPQNPYESEDVFGALVFKDQLYLGMEADNKFGSRLWRTKAGVSLPISQADWEEVAADTRGCPFGNCQRHQGSTLRLQNEHIDSLASFNGLLFASNANAFPGLGTIVYHSQTGGAGTWIQANKPGFGDLNNENFKGMQVFEGQLCGGTANATAGTQIWCTTDGTEWIQKNSPGFGSTRNYVTWSAATYNGMLYFGVENTGTNSANPADDVAKMFRATSLNGAPTWSEVFSGNPGSFRVNILGELNGYLYISHRNPVSGIEILRSSTGDLGSWVQVNRSGMHESPARLNNIGTTSNGATIYNGALYVAIINLVSGVEVWRTSGVTQGASQTVDWVQIGSSGMGNQNNRAAELVTFNGQLYAWIPNYITGQQVRRLVLPP